MVWDTYLARFSNELIAANISKGTRSLREYHMRRFILDHGDLEPAGVTRSILVEWLADHEWSAETRRSYRASLVRFFDWAASSGVIDENPAQRLPSIRPPRAIPRPAPDTAVASAIQFGPARSRLMVELIASTGIRRFECAAVHSDDVVPDLIGSSLRVVGKGGRVRVVPLPDWLAKQIKAADGYLFPGKIDGHLSARRVGELVADALPDHWTAHTLRHRYATRAYSASRDLRAVQELLGHAKPETTAIYTLVQPDRLREVAEAAWAA